jgi:hypothetical protein
VARQALVHGVPTATSPSQQIGLTLVPSIVPGMVGKLEVIRHEREPERADTAAQQAVSHMFLGVRGCQTGFIDA